MVSSPKTKVVDLFAGPGGLGEGFARFPFDQPGKQKFDIRLSIEKDLRAHSTLRLRSFFRQFAESEVPDEYYQALRDLSRPLNVRLKELFDVFPAVAKCADDEAMRAELGNPADKARINKATAKAVDREKHWVLLGGPPCQAYSLVGRSRNQANKDYKPSKDERQFLYQEYLRVVAIIFLCFCDGKCQGPFVCNRPQQFDI